MKNKGIIALFSTLLILTLVVTPTASAIGAYRDFIPAASSSEESLIVNVLEDEGVYSDFPDDNYDGNEAGGGVWVGYDGYGYSRTWLKYDLKHIPKEIGILSAHVNFYCNDEYASPVDLPIGIYYSDDDSWSETSITWNTQPSFDVLPADLIDSPASPDMFVPGNWYSWDISEPFMSSLESDKMLTLVIKQIDEIALDLTWIYFIEKEYNVFLASYLSIEYTTPETTDLTVDGQSTAPLINYIQDSTPDLSWAMSDNGPIEFQRDYALEVSSNPDFSGTQLLSVNHTNIATIHDSSVGNNLRPFGTAAEFRYQMKYDTSLLTTSGVIDKLYFETIDETGTIIFENLLVLLVCTDMTGVLTSDFQANYGSSMPTVVLNRSIYSAEIKDYHFSIDVENTFFLNARQYLIFELRFTNNTGTLTTTPITNDIGGSAAYSYGAGAYTSITAAVTDTRANSLAVEFISEEAFLIPGDTGNYYPFYTDNGYPGRIQLKYDQSFISRTGIIDRIIFPVNPFSDEPVFEGLRVYLAETPVEGALSDTDFDSNYGGVTPTLVLDADVYTFRNIGGALVLDINNTFYYQGEHELIIDIIWEQKISGSCTVFRAMGVGGYRTYNITMSSTPAIGNDTRSYDTILDFVHPEMAIEYAGIPLVNETVYYWRVKTCDSTGIWSDWTSQSFRYMKLNSGPQFSGLDVSPSPAHVASPVTISLDVTYVLGISGVWIEMDGVNHSMTAVGDTYSYTWTPSSAGTIPYTIYMESTIHTWSSMSGTVEILQAVTTTTTTTSTTTTTTTTTTGSTTTTNQTGPPVNTTLLLIIAGSVVGIVIIIIVIIKIRGKE